MTDSLKRDATSSALALRDINAGDAFRDTLLPRRDAVTDGGYPLWHGWAILDAFLAGAAYARSETPAKHPTGITFENWLSYQPFLSPDYGSLRVDQNKYYTVDTVRGAWVAGTQCTPVTETPRKYSNANAERAFEKLVSEPLIARLGVDRASFVAGHETGWHEAASVPSATREIPESHNDDATSAALRAAVREAFEHGVCVKARYTTRGDKWRSTHAAAIKIAMEHPEATSV